MNDDARVHALTMPVAMGNRTVSITPTALETKNGLVLVDVGPEGALVPLERTLADVGFGLADVTQVVLTHHDADHAGGLAALRNRTDPIVAAHSEEGPYIRGDQSPVKGQSDDRYPPVEVDQELHGGQEFETRAGPARVVETPGHTAGHVSLYLPDERLLIAGDALVADGDDPLSGPKPQFTLDMERAADSVGTLAELNVEHTICHHGGYVARGTDRIREIAVDLEADN